MIVLVVSKLYHISDIRSRLYRKGERTVYKKFSALLERDNKTIYRVAADTGISPVTLYDWRDGRYCPKFNKLLILAKYFGVPVEYFAEDENREA